MATITVASITSRITTILQDATGVRWTGTEVLNWLDDGQREVVLLRPEANATNETLALTSGTKQTIPATGIQFIDAIRNTSGGAVRIVSREVLDAQRPDWHTETGSATIKHFTFDPRDPKHFYVYPPSSSANLDILYSKAPTNVTRTGSAPNETGSSTINIDDIYANALIDYVLYRAYSKDAEYAGNAQRAVGHYTAFSQSLGVMTKNVLDRNPNINAGAFNPAVPGGARV